MIPTPITSFDGIFFFVIAVLLLLISGKTFYLIICKLCKKILGKKSYLTGELSLVSKFTLYLGFGTSFIPLLVFLLTGIRNLTGFLLYNKYFFLFFFIFSLFLVLIHMYRQHLPVETFQIKKATFIKAFSPLALLFLSYLFRINVLLGHYVLHGGDIITYTYMTKKIIQGCGYFPPSPYGLPKEGFGAIASFLWFFIQFLPLKFSLAKITSLLTLFYNALIPLSVFFFVKRTIGDYEVGLTSMATLSFLTNVPLNMLTWGGIGNTVILFTVPLLSILFKKSFEQKRIDFAVISGLVTAGSFLIHPYTLFIVFFLVPYLPKLRRDPRKSLQVILLISCIFIGITSPLLLHYYRRAILPPINPAASKRIWSMNLIQRSRLLDSFLNSFLPYFGTPTLIVFFIPGIAYLLVRRKEKYYPLLISFLLIFAFHENGINGLYWIKFLTILFQPIRLALFLSIPLAIFLSAFLVNIGRIFIRWIKDLHGHFLSQINGKRILSLFSFSLYLTLTISLLIHPALNRQVTNVKKWSHDRWASVGKGDQKAYKWIDSRCPPNTGFFRLPKDGGGGIPVFTSCRVFPPKGGVWPSIEINSTTVEDKLTAWREFKENVSSLTLLQIYSKYDLQYLYYSKETYGKESEFHNRRILGSLIQSTTYNLTYERKGVYIFKIRKNVGPSIDINRDKVWNKIPAYIKYTNESFHNTSKKWGATGLPDLTINGGLEKGNWTGWPRHHEDASITTKHPYEGQHAIYFNNSTDKKAAFPIAIQGWRKVEPNHYYHFKMFLDIKEITKGCNIKLRVRYPPPEFLSHLDMETQHYYLLEGVFKAPETASTVSMSAWAEFPSGGGKIQAYIDAVSITEFSMLSIRDGSLYHPLSVKKSELPKTQTTLSYPVIGEKITSGLNYSAKIERKRISKEIEVSESYTNIHTPPLKEKRWKLRIKIPELPTGLYNITWRADNGTYVLRQKGKLWIRNQIKSLQIATVTDQHFFHPKNTNGEVKSAWRKAWTNAWIIKNQINELNPDLVLMLGDQNIAEHGLEPRVMEKYINAFEAPVYVLYGNHEGGYYKNGTTDPLAVETKRARYTNPWFSLKYGMEPGYFYEDFANTRLVCMFSFERQTVTKHDGYITSAQMQWLEDTALKDTPNNTIAAVHSAPLYWDNKTQGRKVQELLDNNNVDLCLAGDIHFVANRRGNNTSYLIGPPGGITSQSNDTFAGFRSISANPFGTFQDAIPVFKNTSRTGLTKNGRVPLLEPVSEIQRDKGTIHIENTWRRKTLEEIEDLQITDLTLLQPTIQIDKHTDFIGNYTGREVASWNFSSKKLTFYGDGTLYTTLEAKRIFHDGKKGAYQKKGSVIKIEGQQIADIYTARPVAVKFLPTRSTFQVNEAVHINLKLKSEYLKPVSLKWKARIEARRKDSGSIPKKLEKSVFLKNKWSKKIDLGHLPPGNYTLLLKIYDPSTGFLVEWESTDVVVSKPIFLLPWWEWVMIVGLPGGLVLSLLLYNFASNVPSEAKKKRD